MSESQRVPDITFAVAIDIYGIKAQIAALEAELDQSYTCYVEHMKSLEDADLLDAAKGLKILHGSGYSTRLKTAGFKSSTIQSLEAEVRAKSNDGEGRWCGTWPLGAEDKRPASGTWIVYQLLDGDSLLYIGSTGDFRTRLKAHEREKSFNSWRASRCDNEAHCRALETVLIDRYRPLLNRMIPTPRLELAQR